MSAKVSLRRTTVSPLVLAGDAQASCPREQFLLVRYFEDQGVAEANVWDLGTAYRMIENTMLSEDKSADQNSFGAVKLKYSTCGHTVQRNFPGQGGI